MNAREQVRRVFTHQQMVDVCARLTKLPIPKCGLDVFVKHHRVRRTNAQNDRLQWLCRVHAGWFNQERLRLIEASVLPKTWPEMDTDSVRHSIFNKHYCGTDSSTKPSKLDMIDILDRYEADLRNQGIEFPPEPVWDVAM